MVLTDVFDKAVTEEEYIELLESERKSYAWTLVKYGDSTNAQAKEIAESFYTYEPISDEHRGLVFHEEAWHWAMIRIKGEQYWLSYPELLEPSQDYNDRA